MQILLFRVSRIFLIITGAFFIWACSLIKIPFYPVSFTLHTLAIFLIALRQAPKLALSSTLCYLSLSTILHQNPIWILGKGGGYLMAFPIAAYLVSELKHSKVLALTAGHLLIYFFGWLWLIPFVGVKVAFLKGVLMFLPSDFLKSWMLVKYVK